MAITSFDITSNKPPKSICSTNSLMRNVSSCRVVKINFVKDKGATSTVNRSPKAKKKKLQSPYLSNDRVQLLSRVTGKRLVHKKTTDFVSSFPLAANIYKANSDELNSLRRVNKKVKKSVLTLPNDPAPLPKSCTVSDMNDFEYHDHKEQSRKSKTKKRPLPNCKKIRVRNKDFEFYDRDARYCSQLNIHLDCSSTDMINYNGDSKRLSKGKQCNKKQPETNNHKAHDVWAVLRNINRFKFQPTPPMSGDSIAISPKIKKGRRRRNACKDTSFIETCHTEEFAYISSYELEDKTSHSFSQSSSFDRITVIDKQGEFSQICEDLGNRIITTNDMFQNTHKVKGRHQNKNKNTNKNTIKSPKLNGNTAAKEKNYVGMNKNNFKIKSLKKVVNYGEDMQKMDKSDIISCKSQPSTIELNPVPYDDKVDFIYSSNQSRSSKAALEVKPSQLNHSKDKNSLLKASSQEFDSQFKGISKVVLSTGPEKLVPKPQGLQKDLLNKKTRRVTNPLSTAIMPKLTQTEVKRRLAHIKFPLVILSKDQVNSEIEIMDYEPPQFDGLNQHIWPFMREWCNDRQPKICETSPNAEAAVVSFTANRNCSPNVIESKSSKYYKNNHEINTNNKFDYKAKRKMTEPVKDKIKPENKETNPLIAINNKLESYKKPKPLFQLKERMLNLLYKKTSNRSITKENQYFDGSALVSENIENKVHVGTDIQAEHDDSIPQEVIKRRYSSSVKSPIVNKKQLNNVKQRWARAKWASDCIENVIRKMKNGVYYTQDNTDNRTNTSHMKEISIQTTPIAKATQIYNQKNINFDISLKESNEENDPLKVITEYDNTLSAVEIETFSRNHIAIKHCITNVVVQFDVSIPTETQIIIDPKKSPSLVPLQVTASQTKIFKSKTTIVNAVLPAELCSIFPKMMRHLIDDKINHIQLPVSFQPLIMDKIDPPDLISILELVQSSSPDILEFVPSLHISPELQMLFVGMFPHKMINCNRCLITTKSVQKISHKMSSIPDLLPKIPLKNLLPYERTRLTATIPRTIRYGTISFPQLHRLPERRISHALEPYIAKNHSLKPIFTQYDLMNLVRIMMRYKNIQTIFKSIALINDLKVQCDSNSLTLNMTAKNSQGLDEKMTLTINTLQLNPFNYVKSKNLNGENVAKNNHIKCIEDIHITNKLENKESKDHFTVATNRSRRKGFFKLYRKCKSTTSISSSERCSNTPLSKITNLDEFLQVLGTKRWMSSVFDGYPAKKILSCLTEMKNWITDINPRQALLILMLTNKKDTPNLVRFRPLLLQGIAVNRITRASELDLEIEVIERENFNKLSQFEGISYLPASVENHDNLLEELYWIAKTTASDYQRPFDESSEKLLKSLLEKRKKLNPSYLRVMARYVGLGLLKSPVKK